MGLIETVDKNDGLTKPPAKFGRQRTIRLRELQRRAVGPVIPTPVVVFLPSPSWRSCQWTVSRICTSEASCKSWAYATFPGGILTIYRNLKGQWRTCTYKLFVRGWNVSGSLAERQSNPARRAAINGNGHAPSSIRQCRSRNSWLGRQWSLVRWGLRSK